MKKFYDIDAKMTLVILLIGIFSIAAGKMFNDYKKEQAHKAVLLKIYQDYEDEVRRIKQANKERLLEMKLGFKFDKDGNRILD